LKAPQHNSTEEKNGLHPRNKHLSRYDFVQLTTTCPDLKPFVSVNQYNSQSIDFADPLAVKTLNRALLQQFYGVEHWDIPADYLCPPIPGRADYIHNLADVLASGNANVVPRGKAVTVLDIGTGANCIYPLIGHKEYGWQFIGSDIDTMAVKVARQIVSSNALDKYIEIRQQSNPSCIFKGIIKPGDKIDITLCNPPFHASAKEANEATGRKWKNLGYQASTSSVTKTAKPGLNFGGQHNELWCKGGELAFITNMVHESIAFKENCLWFSSLVSKSSNLTGIYFALKQAGAVSVKTINMAQGNKISRMVAWTFFTEREYIQWRLNKGNNKL
jgi:23S rRNA (adenine1618-N6)-methyltransferase